MAKWCFNYESGEYEYIEKDGFSIDRGEYVRFKIRILAPVFRFC